MNELTKLCSTGDGPRNCIGMRFGMIQTKLGLATLVRNFSFRHHDKTSYPLAFDNANVLMSPLSKLGLVAERIPVRARQ